MRYRLRTLLILITVLGIWLGLRVNAARRQARAVAEIQKLGGWIKYDFEYDPNVKGTSRTLNASSWVPRWILDRTGLDLFHDVVEINMVYDYDAQGRRADNRRVTDTIKHQLPGVTRLRQLLLKELQASDECLAAVGGLSRLERLYCWDASAATDAGAAHLGRLSRLKYIHLSGSQITDESLRVFGQMPQLEGLSLQQNRFTDRGLAYLKNLIHLKDLWVDLGQTQISDAGLEHLHGLKSLEVLAISETNATSDGVERLKRAIPGLKQVHYSPARQPLSLSTSVSGLVEIEQADAK